MSGATPVFTQFSEIRPLGAPVVALIRTAFGRDPSPPELARLVPLVRGRQPLAAVAAAITGSAEFTERFGGLSRAERADRLCRQAFADEGGQDRGGADARRLAEWDGTDAELLAAVADAALTRGAIPLLPGLVPGAPPDDDIAYRLWVDEYDGPNRPLVPPSGGPLVSLLMLAGDTEAEAVGRSVAALRAQNHPAWELCLAARTLSPWSAQTLAALAAGDPRIRRIEPVDLRAAAAAAEGPLLAVLQPGDQLAPDALARVTAAFETDAIRLVFTDEDVADASGRHSPRFKPGFSPDQPAIGGLAVLRRDVGLPDGELTEDGLAAHATARLRPEQVRHLPAVLLHRAEAPRPRAVLVSAGTPTSFAVPQPPPRVTAIVLTKDRPALLDACTAGLLDRTDYPALDLLLVDNGTADPAALARLAALEAHPRVRVLRRPGPFNFAALNNDAARHVDDGLLLLLNNDVEVEAPGWLGAMVAQLARPGIGIVGARLLYPDRTIQHAGILLGPGGTAIHVGRGAPETEPGYLGLLAETRDFSAVTGACLAIGLDTWRAVGGMDERLAVTWNDIDLCLRVRHAGGRVLATPRATLIHREAQTRGLEAADPQALARFREEARLALRLWPDAFAADPFLNANLVALDSGALALTRPRSPPARSPLARS